MSALGVLDNALREAEIERPALILDLPAMRANLSYLTEHLPRGYAVRLADKSLPVPDLLAEAMEALNTRRIMSFHLPLTAAVLDRFPDAQVMMGKPVPATEAARFLASHPRAAQVIWLIDSATRADRYAALADRFGPIPVAFEVDSGLGRGGFQSPAELSVLPGLTPHAVMGYEAHVSALPRLLGGGARAQNAAMARLAAFREALPGIEIFNTGGSSTALHLPDGGPGNELVVGSAIVKPSDFDQPVNAALRPALFIATPVLKCVSHGLPGHPRLSRALRAFRLIAPRIAFVWGGKWMARPVWPEGLGNSPFYAPSSNQQGFTCAEAPTRVILRPTQSEAVLQQFPVLHLFDGTKISGELRPFPIL
ncbi:MAG: alanine racemase [Paracoccus sp. (in: a-proteobacteria)]|nr:alanine racemase [Paracoccus sp. (in: a-proteobacteria)]